MDFYFLQSSILLMIISFFVLNAIDFIKWLNGIIPTKKCVKNIICQTSIAILIIISVMGMYHVGKIPTDKTTYTELISARYIEKNNHTFFYSNQYEYIEATFEDDGKIIHYKFPLNDIEILTEEGQSMVGIKTIFRPYILRMTEEDYNKVLDFHIIDEK